MKKIRRGSERGPRTGFAVLVALVCLTGFSGTASAKVITSWNFPAPCAAVYLSPPGFSVDLDCGGEEFRVPPETAVHTGKSELDITAESQGTDVLVQWSWNWTPSDSPRERPEPPRDRNVSTYRISAGPAPWSLHTVGLVDNETWAFHHDDGLANRSLWYQVHAIGAEGTVIGQSPIEFVQLYREE